MKTDTQKVKELAEKLGHKAVYESRAVPDAERTGSGNATRKQRGWWMGQTFLGQSAEEALFRLDPIKLGENY